MWDKKIQQNCDSLLFKNFSVPELFRNSGVPPRNFSVLWDKNDRQNRNTPTTQSIIDTRTFLKPWMVRSRCFAAIWDWTFPTERRETPFSSINFFHTRNFRKHGRVHPRCFSATWDKKFPTENVTPAFLSLIFFQTRNFLKHNTVPLKFFSVLRNRKFSTQNRDLSLIWLKFFKTRKSETLKVSPTKVSVQWDIKKSAENRATPTPTPPPPLWLIKVIFPLCKNSFVTRNLVIQRSVPYEVFQENETKNNRRRIVKPPSTLLNNFF